MRRVADQVHAQFGPINGIIHAAGVLDDAPMLQKDRTSAARVLAPKVRGTLVLDSVFQQDSIDFFVLMSSVSSHLAPAGQMDYAAANAFLDAFARSKSQKVLATSRSSGLGGLMLEWRRNLIVTQAPAHPLLGRAKHEGQGRTTYSTTLSLEDDWIVSEHRLSGSAGSFPPLDTSKWCERL